MLETAKFRSASDDQTYLTFEQSLQQAIDYINEDKEAEYAIMVGSDSLWRPWHTVFATVFAVHRKGKGARFWYTRSKEKFPRNIPVRLMKEANDSVEVMRAIYESELMLMVPEENFSIHIDVGNHGESKQVINEIVGFVTGQGFECEYKPNSACATTCADKCVR